MTSPLEYSPFGIADRVFASLLADASSSGRTLLELREDLGQPDRELMPELLEVLEGMVLAGVVEQTWEAGAVLRGHEVTRARAVYRLTARGAASARARRRGFVLEDCRLLDLPAEHDFYSHGFAERGITLEPPRLSTGRPAGSIRLSPWLLALLAAAVAAGWWLA